MTRGLNRALKTGAFLIAVAASVGYGYSRMQKAAAMTKAALATARTIGTHQGTITIKVSESGVLEPVTQVEVKSKVAGRVQHIYIKEGDNVRAGTLLAIIDPIEITREIARIKTQLAAAQAGLHQAEESYALVKRQDALAVRRAEASLTEARARLAQTAAPSRIQDVSQAEESITRADTQVVDAKRTLERKKALQAKGFISQSEVDAAQVAVTLAETDAASARARVSLLKEGPRREDVATARAGIATAQLQLATEKANAGQEKLRLRDIERARADVAQIETQLVQQDTQMGETHIVAPASGQIIGKFVEQGELIASATQGFAQGATLVKIADLSRMQVRVNVNEVDIARVRVGQPVEIKVDGAPGAVFTGRIASIAPSSAGDQKSGASSGGAGTGGVVRFEVKITVLSPDRRLRPGMTAAVDIIQARHRNVTLLPAEAVKPGDKVTVVKVGAGADNKPQKSERKLAIGLRDDSAVEVLGGLASGERVEIPRVAATDRRKVEMGPD